MKTFKLIGVALGAFFMSLSFASCRTDDELSKGKTEGTDDKEVDFTKHTPTDLKINGQVFWYRYDYNCVNESDYGEGESYIGFLFSGKTKEMAWAEFGLHEDLLQHEFLNTNKNIAPYIYFKGAVKNDQYLQYDYSYGRISIRIDNGIFKLNFNNAVFKNDEIDDERVINGSITYQL